MAPSGAGGQKTFVVRPGDTVAITNFGGVGTGNNPSAAEIAEVDTLKFEGTGLSARNMLLTQQGSDLVITFAGGGNTRVILEDFDLEDLENLRKSSGASADIGNILFDGQTQIQDSFDVINANQNLNRVSRSNTVTFLNDLDNTTQGRNNSNDVINGQGGDDELDGLSGNDLLRGGKGNDNLDGGGGNDNLDGGDGSNVLNGGAGNDTLSSRNSSFSSSREVLYGGDGDDTLTGTSTFDAFSDNLLYGGNGNDRLRGGEWSSNTLYGGDGNDTLEGGDYAATNILYGGDGNDTLRGGGSRFGSNNTLYGGDGNDVLVGSGGGSYQGENTLRGGDGNDTLEGGGFSANVLYGGDGNDTLRGGSGITRYSDESSINTLYGGDGNDVLEGGNADSTDTLTGGLGRDQFVFKTDAPFATDEIGVDDTITDFSGANAAGGDVIVLDKTTFTTLASPAGGPLQVAEFASVANDSLAGDVGDDIVFSRATGNLFYNPNGAAAGFGTGDQFATLTEIANLAATDFLIQA